MFRIRPEWRYDPTIVFPGRSAFHAGRFCCADGRRICSFQKPLAVWRMRADGSSLSRRLVFDEAELWSYWLRTQKSRGNGERDRGADSSRQKRSTSFCARAMSVPSSTGATRRLRGFPPPLGPRTVSADEDKYNMFQRLRTGTSHQGGTSDRRAPEPLSAGAYRPASPLANITVGS